jgi:hypothetical protein
LSDENKLDSADYIYFKEAMDGLLKAQSIVSFIQNVLITKYGLKEGDTIELDGKIVRGEGDLSNLPEEVQKCLIPSLPS